MTQVVETKGRVTKDMIIGDVLKLHPDIASIMLEQGLHCVGCHANVYDTIEAGCKVHGIGDDVIDQIVSDINELLEDVPQKQSDDLPQIVNVSESAAKKIVELLEKGDQKGYGLRVMVMPGGCSGYVYQMSFEKSAEADDLVFEDKGVKLFVDKESMQMLKGSEVDYVDTLNESGFKINNPNSEHGCGCGKSFG